MSRDGGRWSKNQSRGIVGAPAVSLCVLLACGQGPDNHLDSGAEPDTGVDASDARVSAPAPPNIPWLAAGLPPIAPPMFTPCPEGWHEVVVEDPEGEVAAVTCDPYGDEPGGGEPDVCADGWVHFVGEAGCTPVGAPCPVGNFPEGLPTDGEVLYVLGSAAPGGDGTRANPLATIADAMALASAGTIVAIGKGVYEETVLVGTGITLWGACAAETRLTAAGPGSLTPGVITVTTGEARVTNLHIGPAELPGLIVMGADASVSLDGLIIDAVKDIGLLVTDGATVRGDRLAVVGTRPDDEGAYGYGILVQRAGSRADLVLARSPRFPERSSPGTVQTQRTRAAQARY